MVSYVVTSSMSSLVTSSLSSVFRDRDRRGHVVACSMSSVFRDRDRRGHVVTSSMSSLVTSSMSSVVTGSISSVVTSSMCSVFTSSMSSVYRNRDRRAGLKQTRCLPNAGVSKQPCERKTKYRRDKGCDTGLQLAVWSQRLTAEHLDVVPVSQRREGQRRTHNCQMLDFFFSDSAGFSLEALGEQRNTTYITISIYRYRYCVAKGCNDTCIRIEPNRNGRHSTVHGFTRRIHGIKLIKTGVQIN